MLCCEGCTAGSTLVNQQLREIRDAPNASERCRSKQQSAWPVPRSRSDMDQSVFRIYKGIKCFDFCKSQNVIATGGMTLTAWSQCTELHFLLFLCLRVWELSFLSILVSHGFSCSVAVTSDRHLSLTFYPLYDCEDWGSHVGWLWW